MPINILYIEDNREAQTNIRRVVDTSHRIVYTEDLLTFDERLYDEEGFNTYDFLILDLALAMPGDITLDDLREAIPEFGPTYTPTYCEAYIPLIGFDYFNLVVNKRDETKAMVNEGRVVLLSGHAKKLRDKEIFTQQKFPNVTLIDRGEKGAYNELLKIIKTIEERLHN